MTALSDAGDRRQGFVNARLAQLSNSPRTHDLFEKQGMASLCVFFFFGGGMTKPACRLSGHKLCYQPHPESERSPVELSPVEVLCESEA